MGCHKYLPSCITCTSKHSESAAMTLFLSAHVDVCVCVSECGICALSGARLMELFLLFQTVSKGPLEQFKQRE